MPKQDTSDRLRKAWASHRSTFRYRRQKGGNAPSSHLLLSRQSAHLPLSGPGTRNGAGLGRRRRGAKSRAAGDDRAVQSLAICFFKALKLLISQSHMSVEDIILQLSLSHPFIILPTCVFFIVVLGLVCGFESSFHRNLWHHHPSHGHFSAPSRRYLPVESAMPGTTLGLIPLGR